MSIATEIARIQGNVSDSLAAVANKGVTVPVGSNSDDLAGLIALIQTGSGGGTVTWETMYDASTGIVSSDPNYFIISDYTTPIQDGETYRVTWGTGGTQYVCETRQDNSGTTYDGYFFGNLGLVGYPDDNTGEPFFIYRNSATTLAGVTNASGGQNIYITIEKQTISSGGTATDPVLVTKTITANGIYDPADDNADGYSSVTVNVTTGTSYTTLFDDYVYVHSGSPNWISVDASTTHPIQGESYSDYTHAFEANQTYRITWDGVTYICQTQQETLGQTYDGYYVGTNTDEPFTLARGSNLTLLGSTSSSVGNIPIKIEIQTSSGGGTANLQAKTNISPTTSSQTITADSGYDGLSSVQINAMPSGTAGTPTATKGTVSNHSVSVTPSVTNTTGYITGSTKTGTAVTVTASELASGNKEITSNGTNIDVVGYSTVSVAVSSSSGKNTQHAPGFGRTNQTAYTAISGQSITVSKTGTYDVYWCGYRSSTGGTNGSCLYIGNSAHTSGNQTTFDGTATNAQAVHISNVNLTEDQVVTVRARARGTNYWMYVFGLTIVEV